MIVIGWPRDLSRPSFITFSHRAHHLHHKNPAETYYVLSLSVAGSPRESIHHLRQYATKPVATSDVMMECDICTRGHDANRLPFLCVVDARNRIYDGRMKNLQLMLQNEELRHQVDSLDNETVGSAQSQLREIEMRTDQIVAAADKLRVEMQAAKEEIQIRKAAISRRKSDLASVSTGIADRRVKQQKEVEKSTQMLNFRWSQNAEDTAGTRAFLCKESLRLYGLRRVKKSGGRYEYSLGRLPILDLSQLESTSAEVLSTSLAHMAHIVVLIAHYLAVRLPAEIILPHRDYPRPTIFNLAGSYRHGDVSFNSTPGADGGGGGGGGGVPEMGTSDYQRAPRPRPLFIDKPLNQLLKDDPASYSFFLEAVTLLAYDIAWLCCSQGSSIGDKSSFDDLCNMGRNLYNLYVSFSLQHTVRSSTPQKANDYHIDTNSPQWVGRYSHGTMYYFLGGADGAELVKTFKLPSPMKLADKLRKKLLGDAPVADWEVVDDDAWKMEDVSVAQQNPAGTTNALSSRRDSTGWMKVKSR